MAQFSHFFPLRQAHIEALSALSEPLRSFEAVVEDAEVKGLETEDVASLLAWGRDPNRRVQISDASRRVRDRTAVKAVEFIIPVYLTSFCQNDCLYCGYRRTNPLAERIRLTLEEYERELDLILSWGHRQIELVLSDDPEFGPGYLAPYIELTKERLEALGGGRVALCAPVYEEDDYRRLKAAGLNWVAEWQETYHQPHFDRWHFPGSPKRQYEFRLDVWDRAIAAGFTQVALGVLFGLFDWRCDVLALTEHVNYLRRTYGVEPHAVGIPRLKSARGVLASQKPSRFTVSDEDYESIVSVYHLAFPRSRLFFNTRESYEFNMSMVAAGDLFTVDCETLPGGYRRRYLPGQFSTHYYPPRREVAKVFRRRGFTCCYLEAEKATPPFEPVAVSAEQPVNEDLDLEGWARGHEEIRAHLVDWETALARLVVAAEAERRAATEGLRGVVRYFETVVIDHCRHEETVLLPAFRHRASSPVHIQNLRADHERLGVDLDKFERQLVSYELSGDPTVLVTLGARIIRELREHLKAEEELLAGDQSSERDLRSA